MTHWEEVDRLEVLLRAVAEGRTTARAALEKIEELTSLPWASKPFEGAFHSLQHYAVDSDIREREPDYAADQQRALLHWAEKLRSLRDTSR